MDSAPLGLILFVAGEPDTGAPSIRRGTMSLTNRMIGMSAAPSLEAIPPPGPSPAMSGGQSLPSGRPPWRLPPEQIHCVNTVVKVAKKEGCAVTVIDVDTPGDQEYLVTRWVGADPIFPLLVRADGSKLMGIENFTARMIRQFIRGR